MSRTRWTAMLSGMKRLAPIGVMVAAFAMPMVATGGTATPFRAEASQLCERILNQIHEPPHPVTRVSQVTPATGDLFLSSAAAAFARLSARLDALKPPPVDLAQYRRMTSEFKAASSSFSAAKTDLDAGRHAAFVRKATQ